MNDHLYDDMTIEKIARELFALDITVGQVIIRRIDVGRGSTATVFLTNKKQLYAYIASHSKLTYGDIRKTIARMGLKAELYVPPRGQIDYFDQIGRQKFQEVFPGRRHISSDDIVFYKTLAPYNPALVLIGEVTNGEIYQYDSDSRTKWRIAVKFMYRRIKTS